VPTLIYLDLFLHGLVLRQRHHPRMLVEMRMCGSHHRSVPSELGGGGGCRARKGQMRAAGITGFVQVFSGIDGDNTTKVGEETVLLLSRIDWRRLFGPCSDLNVYAWYVCACSYIYVCV